MPKKRKVEKIKDDFPLRITQFRDMFLIPPYLIEQIKNRDYEPEDIYRNANLIMASPNTLLYLFLDNNHKIKGFLWASINPINRKIIMNILSVDKEYQSIKGEIIKKALEVLNAVKDQLGLKSVYTILDEKRSRSAIKSGFNKTGKIILEA